jgi:glycosyltransferase involved in cell wall biosynthesis
MPDIAFFLPNLNGGGAERVLLNLAIGFADRGFSVDLVLAKAKGDYLPEVPAHVTIVDLNAQRLIAGIPALTRYLKRNRPPVMIAALEEANLIAIACQRLTGAPTRIIVTVHNHLSTQLQHSSSLKQRLIRLLLRQLYPAASAIVAVSQGVADDLVQLGGLSPAQVKVIYNPIITSALLSKMQEPISHPWLSPSSPQPVILGVGRLNRQKDFQTLIRAIAQVRQQRQVRLIILGEGEERPHLEALVQQLNLVGAVDLPGFSSNPQALMRQSSLLVMSSAWEGFGNVLVEALAAGTPVVSTHCRSGPAEILDQGRYGELVAVGDVQGLAQAILTTLDRPLEAQALQQRSQQFSLDKILLQYCKIARLPIPKSSPLSATPVFVPTQR